MKKDKLFTGLLGSVAIQTWTYRLLFLYLFFYYVRPQEYIPGATIIPTSFIIFTLLSIVGVLSLNKKLLQTPLAVILFMAVVFMSSGIGIDNVNPFKVGFNYLTKFLPHCALLYLFFTLPNRVNKLVGLWVVIYFFMSLITIKNGGLGPGDFTRDPNDVTLALTIGFPIVYASLFQPGLSKFAFLFRAGTLALIVAAIAMAGSRGGFLGFIAVLLMTWFYSRRRMRNALLSVLALLMLSGVVIAMLPPDYFKEMETISDPEDDTRVERFRLWETAWEMYKDQPILGVGVGQFPLNVSEFQKRTSWYTGNEKNLHGKVTHSVFFQVLAEVGTLGMCAYMYIMLVLPLRIHLRYRHETADTPESHYLRRLMEGLVIGLGSYWVSGAFISVAYYPHLPIWVAMYCIVVKLHDNTKKPADAKK